MRGLQTGHEVLMSQPHWNIVPMWGSAEVAGTQSPSQQLGASVGHQAWAQVGTEPVPQAGSAGVAGQRQETGQCSREETAGLAGDWT